MYHFAIHLWCWVGLLFDLRYRICDRTKKQNITYVRKIKFMQDYSINRLILATVLGASATLGLSASASAQIASGYSSYYVRHNFNWNLGGIPNLVAGNVSGSAVCFNPFNGQSYNTSAFALGNPAGVNITRSASAGCQGAAAFATSNANGVIVGNNITGSTQARGYAYAFAPPGGAARARSSAALTASQLGVNRNGQITWRPLFWSYVSGTASAFAQARPVDPIAYTITDPTTGNIIRTGNLLDISGDFGALGSKLEWGVAGTPPENPGSDFPLTITGDPTTDETAIATDDNLDISFLNDGSFKIDITDPAVSNPGLLDLACSGGLITNANTSGRFSGLLPSIGQSCTFSIPLSQLNTDISYDFTGLIPTDADLGFSLGGSGDAIASVPEPTSTLGLLALGTLGAGATLKRKLKSS
jgi:hypothetical protein